MVAARDLKYAARVGVDAFLDILHPGTVHATGIWFSVLHATVQA